MSVARYFPALVKYADRIYVFDGIKEPEEYGSPVPPYDLPDPDYTTIPVTTIPVTTIPATTIPAAPTTTTSVGSVAGKTTTSLVTTTSTP